MLQADARGAQHLAQSLFEAGIWVQALQPPWVPSSVTQIRIALSAGHSLDDVERLADTLKQVANKPNATHVTAH